MLDVLISSDQKAARASRWILNRLAGLRLHQAHDAVDERARRKVLARTALLLARVALEQAFVEIPQALFLGAEPIQLVDVFDQLLQVARMLDAGLRVGKDLFDAIEFGLSAEMQEQAAVERELLGAFAGSQIIPTIALGDLILDLAPLLLGHFEEEEVGELGHVLVVRDAVIAQDVTKVPEPLDDFLGFHGAVTAGSGNAGWLPDFVGKLT
ncbi:MAG TPA: hypothetical protein VKP30_01715 [Polyangiaceae bacterium]|nr:hypothetical protein [Polyangiaceae bacterium]